MKLFQRKQPQPVAANPHSADTVAMPAIESVKTIIERELIMQCAACGKLDATIPLKVSYFGFIALPFVKICEACEANRQARHRQHYIPMRKTVLETPAVKPGMVIVGEPGPEIITPSRDAVVVPNKPQVDTPMMKIFLDGKEIA